MAMTLSEIMSAIEEYQEVKKDLKDQLSQLAVTFKDIGITSAITANSSSESASKLLSRMSDAGKITYPTKPELDAVNNIPGYYNQPITPELMPSKVNYTDQELNSATGTNVGLHNLKFPFTFTSKQFDYIELAFRIPLNTGDWMCRSGKASDKIYPTEIVMIRQDDPTDVIVYRNMNYGMSICRGKENGNLLIYRNRYDIDGSTYKSLWISKKGESLSYIDCDRDTMVLVMPDEPYASEIFDTTWTCYVSYSLESPVNRTARLPRIRQWCSICYGNGKYIAVAKESNVFAYSTDGINWTEGTISSTNRSWYSVCYGNGKFVVVGNRNIFVSTDGINWAKSNMLIDRLWHSVCYGNGKYITVAYATTIFAYSTDGINWTEVAAGGTSRQWYSVCYGNGKYIAVANNNNIFAYSDDGFIWTEGNISSTKRAWWSVCYGNGKFVAIAYNNNIFAYSTDGTSWTEGNLPNSRYWNTVCYGNGKFIAVAGNTVIFAYSTDGITWTEGTISSANYIGWDSVCYGNGKFIVIITSLSSSAYSTDGITWTDQVNEEPKAFPDYKYTTRKISISDNMANEVTVGNNSRYWQSVCYGNGKYIAVAGSTNIFAYSTDGINWTEGNISSTNRSWNSVCYGNGKYIAVAQITNIFAYSTDGINWTEGNIGSTGRQWRAVCYGNGKYVAVVYNSNTFAYSTDGITWTEGNISSTNREWYSVCYGKDKFVAVTNNSNVFAYSADGITWTEVSVGSTKRSWYSVCYGNGKYIAVAYASNIFAYSTDGINWTEGNIGSINRYWRSVCYGNGKYISIVYNSNIFAYSNDGITWTEGNISNTNRYWFSVCYGNGKYIAVTENTNVFASINLFTIPTEYAALQIVNNSLGVVRSEGDATAVNNLSYSLSNLNSSEEYQIFKTKHTQLDQVANLPGFTTKTAKKTVKVKPYVSNVGTAAYLLTGGTGPGFCSNLVSKQRQLPVTSKSILAAKMTPASSQPVTINWPGAATSGTTYDTPIAPQTTLDNINKPFIGAPLPLSAEFNGAVYANVMYCNPSLIPCFFAHSGRVYLTNAATGRTTAFGPFPEEVMNTNATIYHILPINISDTEFIYIYTVMIDTDTFRKFMVTKLHHSYVTGASGGDNPIINIDPTSSFTAGAFWIGYDNNRNTIMRVADREINLTTNEVTTITNPNNLSSIYPMVDGTPEENIAASLDNPILPNYISVTNNNEILLMIRKQLF